MYLLYSVASCITEMTVAAELGICRRSTCNLLWCFYKTSFFDSILCKKLFFLSS